MLRQNRYLRRWVPGLAVLLSFAALATQTATAPASGIVAKEPVPSNGDFEIGTLAGWQVFDLGSGRWDAATGTKSPVSGFKTPAPPQGKWQAVVDQSGPGSRVLYRNIQVPDNAQRLKLTLWYANRADKFYTPRSLKFKGQRNQQLRIDIVRRAAPLRSMAADDILATIFRTREGDPRRMAPRLVRRDITRFQGRNVRLRVAEVDTQSNFLAGVDAVRVLTG